jgi:hypothetical protein
MPKATKPNTMPAIVPRPPLVPRTIRHLDTDEQWNSRSIENQVHCTASDAAYRLRGMAQLLYALSLTEGRPRGVELAFLGGSANDIALALERVTVAQWAAREARDAKHLRKAAGRRAAA